MRVHRGVTTIVLSSWMVTCNFNEKSSKTPSKKNPLALSIGREEVIQTPHSGRLKPDAKMVGGFDVSAYLGPKSTVLLFCAMLGAVLRSVFCRGLCGAKLPPFFSRTSLYFFSLFRPEIGAVHTRITLN